MGAPVARVGNWQSIDCKMNGGACDKAQADIGRTGAGPGAGGVGGSSEAVVVPQK